MSREDVRIDPESGLERIGKGCGVASKTLIDELEDAVEKKDLRQRAAVMRRVTDLFMVQGSGMSDEHVAMFDDVMSRLVAAIDNSARAEFGDRLAKLPIAPPRTLRLLALDEAIEVAGPLLSQSESIDEDTLMTGAKTKSQEHLLAISRRRAVGEAVTDLLVERGNQRIVRSIASNAGAKFSDFGCSTLAMRARDDGGLALCVWSRSDIPRQHLLSVFATASEEVRKQFETTDRAKAELYRYIVAEAASEVQTNARETSEGFVAARARVEALHRSGELSERHLLAFARARQFDEATIALSLMCDLPVGHIERAVVHDHADQIIVVVKSLELSWETAKAVLLMSAPSQGDAGRELAELRASFAKLQTKTAKAAMEFYRLRARAGTSIAG